MPFVGLYLILGGAAGMAGERRPMIWRPILIGLSAVAWGLLLSAFVWVAFHTGGALVLRAEHLGHPAAPEASLEGVRAEAPRFERRHDLQVYARRLPRAS